MAVKAAGGAPRPWPWACGRSPGSIRGRAPPARPPASVPHSRRPPTAVKSGRFDRASAAGPEHESQRRLEATRMRLREPAGGADRARRVIRRRNVIESKSESYENRTRAPCLPGRNPREDKHGAARDWGPKGERLPGPAPFGHWNTSTLTAALRDDRTDAPWVFDGPVNGEVFLTRVTRDVMRHTLLSAVRGQPCHLAGPASVRHAISRTRVLPGRVAGTLPASFRTCRLP